MARLDHSIAAGLKEFPEAFRESIAFADVRNNYEALIERLRFLSPLKLSGQKTRVTLTGVQIFEYLKRFFGTELAQQGIELDASKSFLKFTVYEQPARLLPVFINLVNNAAYWVSYSSQEDKKILLDAVDERVVISDSGPGVDPDDIGKLFRLFFSRKARGGRGVGLYLCRANLAAGGHTIEYGTDLQQSKLSGAKFLINFRGGKYE
jgi:C4-dicarboxylate-specific signal transduction histidine kinase